MAVKTFTTGEVLTASNTNTYLNNGGLVWIATATASGTARALAIDNVFTSTYSHFRVVVSLGSTVNSNLLYFQLLNSSGSTVATSYYSSTYGRDYTTGATAVTADSATTLAYIGAIPNGATTPLGASFDIWTPADSGRPTAWAGQYTGVYSGVAFRGGEFYGWNTLVQTNRGIRFDNTGAGNLTGSVSVYGYRIS